MLLRRTGRQPKNSSLDGFGNRVLVITFCASATTVIDPLSGLTDYGHPERAFFKNLKLLGLGRHFGLKCFEAFVVFSAGLSAPILVL